MTKDYIPQHFFDEVRSNVFSKLVTCLLQELWLAHGCMQIRGLADGCDCNISYDEFMQVHLFPELIKASCSMFGTLAAMQRYGTSVTCYWQPSQALGARLWPTSMPLSTNFAPWTGVSPEPPCSCLQQFLTMLLHAQASTIRWLTTALSPFTIQKKVRSARDLLTLLLAYAADCARPRPPLCQRHLYWLHWLSHFLWRLHWHVREGQSPCSAIQSLIVVLSSLSSLH